MRKLKIKYFKAYKEEIYIDFKHDKKNLLLYGENGSGKSSLFEAIKVIFFRDKLKELITDASTPEEEESNRNEFWKQYNNRQSLEDFQIVVNEESPFDSSNYQVFMIAMDRVCFQDRIELDNLLKMFNLHINNIDILCFEKYQTIEENVNNQLKNFKEDNIEIMIDNEDDFSIKIKDSIRGLDYKDNLSQYFNEAKLNLIILLLLFESISLSEDGDKKKILVLDDFITSLDMANRTFLIQYIFDKFDSYQKIILTHNVYFYNLIMYISNDIFRNNNKWLFGNIYEINNIHKLYFKGELTVNKIKNRYSSNSSDTESIGNDIRKRFEQLLHEISKLFMIGAVEDSKKIIENIENNKAIYWKKRETRRDKNKTATNLIYDIEAILDSDNLKESIESKIEEYKIDDLNNIKIIIRDLKLYQKVTMHPLSHSSDGLSSFTQKEIEKSLLLLEKLETDIKGLIGSDVDGA